eukprot:TRINITY_DN97292_c0_g1_i1.p1 TRINITY_DN97292_c0_g1~~TRINITY_DN97292_c0_g1_i1.p1  ORF type:complete len:213 (+),score=94.49 TRINITY_DN97292_c0_g1_i1:46-684(+)
MVNKVFFYIPNLIGYARIVFAVLSVQKAFVDWQASVFFYFLSQGMDAIDGVAARHFNQSSRFGAVLDMLCDRMTSVALLVVLAIMYTEWWGTFTALIVLDLVAHWLQMYSALSRNQSTHKGSLNPIIRFYYSFPTLFLTCSGDQFFFMGLYMLRHSEGMLVSVPMLAAEPIGAIRLLVYVCFPISLFKQLTNVIQMFQSMSEIASMPNAKSG